MSQGNPVQLPTLTFVRRFALMAALPAVVLLTACGSDNGGGAGDQGPVHVHGLGINPKDGALFIATHTGLFRSAEGQTTAERVGEQLQDTMGFTVVGPDRFLGSGHPAPGENRPPNLGLIESKDAGVSWRDVSLLGQVDFHVLRSAGQRVYGYNATGGQMLISANGGLKWKERQPPAPLIDFALDPDDPHTLISSSERGLSISTNEGRRWRPVRGDIGLLAWPTADRLYLIDSDGRVQISREAGKGWKQVGAIPGQPAAFIAAGRKELYAALADGTVMESDDGGGAWRIRSSPS
jgi:hypothetical protein